MALQPSGAVAASQFLNPIYSGYDCLHGGSARRKAANYKQTMHASSRIRTHGPSVWTSEDSSCL
jgi:hypothetical protein